MCLSRRSYVFTPIFPEDVSSVTILLHKNQKYLFVIKKIKWAAKSNLTHLSGGENDHRYSTNEDEKTVKVDDHMLCSHKNSIN